MSETRNRRLAQRLGKLRQQTSRTAVTRKNAVSARLRRLAAKESFHAIEIETQQQQQPQSVDAAPANRPLVVFLTRFSILDAKRACFRLTRDSQASELRSRLFDTQRLQRKFVYFQRLTLPSLVNQSAKDWQWFIYYGAGMPSHFVDRLLALCAQHKQICCRAVDDFKQFDAKMQTDVAQATQQCASFFTVRLDDDDALHRQFVERLQRHAHRTGIISFPHGRRVTYDKSTDQMVVGSAMHCANSAVGMAAIGFNVFDAGCHSTVDQRHRVHYDHTPKMYLQACDPFCDTQRSFR